MQPSDPAGQQLTGWGSRRWVRWVGDGGVRSVAAIPRWGLVVVAGAAAGGALIGIASRGGLGMFDALRTAPSPLLIAMLVVVGAAATAARVPSMVAGLALVLAVGLGALSHGARSVASLDRPVPAQVRGVAAVVTDPEDRFGSTTLIVELGDRRYRVNASDSGARSLAVGQRVKLQGRPNASGVTPMDRRLHVSAVVAASQLPSVARASGLWAVGNEVRAKIRAGFGPADADTAALLASLIVGDDRQLSPATRDLFRRAGLSHVLVVSGQNLALLLAGFKPLLMRLGPRLRIAATMVVVVGFVVVARPEPSVLRAAAMALVAMYAAWSGRTGQGIRVVALAVCGCVLADPLLVTSVGFWMSVAASAGIVCWSRTVAATLERVAALPAWLAGLIGVTVAAQVAVAPLVLAVGGPMPLASLWTNVLAEPVVFVVTVGGPVAAVAHWLIPAASVPVAAPLWCAARVLTEIAGFASRHPVGAIDGREALVLLVGLVALATARRRPQVWVFAAAAAVLVAGVHHPSPAIVELPGGCVVRQRDRSILVIESVRSADLVLSRWTKSGAPSADVALVVGSSTTGARLIGQLRRAARVGAVYAPAGSSIRSARSPPNGADLAAATLLCRGT